MLCIYIYTNIKPSLSLSPLPPPSQSHYHGPSHGRLREVEEASEVVTQANEVIEQRKDHHMRRQVGMAGTPPWEDNQLSMGKHTEQLSRV